MDAAIGMRQTGSPGGANQMDSEFTTRILTSKPSFDFGYDNVGCPQALADLFDRRVVNSRSIWLVASLIAPPIKVSQAIKIEGPGRVINAKRVGQINELARDRSRLEPATDKMRTSRAPTRFFVNAGWRDATNLHKLYDMRFPLPTPVKTADLTVVPIRR
jgi:hypothetical protein